MSIRENRFPRKLSTYVIRENQFPRNVSKIYEPRIFEFLSDTMSFGLGFLEAIGCSVICLSESINFYLDHSQNH